MLEAIRNALWGPVTSISILLLGVVLMFKTKFYTVTRLHRIFTDTVFSVRKNRRSFGLMCTSLGGTIGVGNAIGVAGAITEGGAGAVFWMAIAGILGMTIKYAEIYLSLIYKTPIGYIEHGVGSRSMASFYALLCICVSFGMGNMAQVKSAVSAIDGVFDATGYLPSVAMAIVFIAVIKGGLEKIKNFSEIAVPFITVFYTILLVIIIFKQRRLLPEAFGTVLSGTGIISGIKWSLIKRGITGGFSKAIFSSEAGLGSAGFAHTESNLEPREQAKWGIVEVFVDSVMCILTAMALLTFTPQLSGVSEAFMTRGIFALSFGRLGEVFFGASMMIFAFSSILCWYYNGSCAVGYLCKSVAVKRAYCICFTAVIIISGVIKDSTVISLSDIANAFMVIVNTSALWVLVFKNRLTF